MLFKFLVCLVLVAAVVVAIDLGEPGLHFDHHAAYASKYDNYQPHDYQFNYGVSDPHTGDHKSQWEVKEKGVVRGGYSLLEPDGTTRVVEYIADDHGFRAVVKKLGTSEHPSEHVETHGFQSASAHHVDAVPAPAKIPVQIVETPTYQAYDGHAGNYAGNVLGSSVVQHHYEPVVAYKSPSPIASPPLQSVGYHDFQNQHFHRENQISGHYSQPERNGGFGGYQSAPLFDGYNAYDKSSNHQYQPYFQQQSQFSPFGLSSSAFEARVDDGQFGVADGNFGDGSGYTGYDNGAQQSNTFGNEYTASSNSKTVSVSFNNDDEKQLLPYQFDGLH